MKPLDAKLHELAIQIVGLQKQAKALGLFVNDRELLACANCDLMEDVASTGLLITCRRSPYIAGAFATIPMPMWM